ncbi:MAG: hypothetical protein JXB32_21340 [Deltaproteobacteria bacterium]|nr:hypothetical protein [Deltaproteobacteria bacterium]
MTDACFVSTISTRGKALDGGGDGIESSDGVVSVEDAATTRATPLAPALSVVAVARTR